MRLMKYLRDIKATFSCKSILLTTLLAERVTQADAYCQARNFPDLPTALKTLMGRLGDDLQARPRLHDISNPVLPRENFNRHWDQDKYSTFGGMIHQYRNWIDEAYAETDRAKSVTKWQRVFGDEFSRGSDNVYVGEAANAAPPIALAPRYNDAVTAVRLVGRGILDQVRRDLPWVQAPPWIVVQQGRVSVEIRATLHDQKNGPFLGTVQSGTILPKYKNIRFEAFAGNSVPVASIREYQVQWQVVNTDHDAYYNRQLRGGFYRSDEPGKKWEYTQYRGIHWVEAFLIRKRDGKCAGKSPRFFVVIE
jgi:Adenylyl/Guanylyl and SMODS C-terminal sensor domain